MSETKYDNLYANLANAKVCSGFPNTPYEYYGEIAGKCPEEMEWVGGELVYLTGQSRLYINTATSGQTATWYRLADTFATSTSTTTSTTSTTTSSTTTTTSTSTSTSSSTSTTSTSSSTTSSTSTSTTSTSSSSTSTSSSSTTTA